MSLVGAIDQGTSSSRFLLFSSESGKVVASHQVETTSIHPHEGWCQQDPKEILSSVQLCIKKTIEKCVEKNINVSDIKAIGITNQRESTIVWDKLDGEPLYPAIIWLDGRTVETVDKLIEKTDTKDKNEFQKVCGLPISTYFSAVKLRWILDNCEDTQKAVKENRCNFGTVDTWLLWNLTGGCNNGVYATDVTNASRTMLMNLSTLKWDDQMCKFFDVDKQMLPDIRSSSEIYGKIYDGPLKGIPIAGILGDQQAALVGQKCFSQGDAKNTYGTGNFLLYNTGKTPVVSNHGLLTTVGYQFGPNQPAMYALEGSIAITGAAVKWLRDSLGIIKDAKETADLASSVKDNGDVYFVPAFSGLFAPHWETNARGMIIGITQYTTKAHIVRATLEAVCFQTKEILDAMNGDSGIPLSQLLVDGGMTSNDFLMQLQANILNIDVVRAKMAETTALGAAIAAGIAEGVNCWKIDTQAASHGTDVDRFTPKLHVKERDTIFGRWLDAVKRSMQWI